MGGKSAGEGELPRLTCREGEGRLFVAHSLEVLGNHGTVEVGLGHLDLFHRGLFDHNQAVGDGARVDEGHLCGPAFGKGVDRSAFGPAVEVHAVVVVTPRGNNQDFDGFVLRAFFQEVFFRQACDHLLLDARRGAIRRGRMRSVRGRRSGVGGGQYQRRGGEQRGDEEGFHRQNSQPNFGWLLY